MLIDAHSSGVRSESSFQCLHTLPRSRGAEWIEGSTNSHFVGKVWQKMIPSISGGRRSIGLSSVDTERLRER